MLKSLNYIPANNSALKVLYAYGVPCVAFFVYNIKSSVEASLLARLKLVTKTLD